MGALAATGDSSRYCRSTASSLLNGRYAGGPFGRPPVDGVAADSAGRPCAGDEDGAEAGRLAKRPELGSDREGIGRLRTAREGSHTDSPINPMARGMCTVGQLPWSPISPPM
jgi:hypothetical protein